MGQEQLQLVLFKVFMAVWSLLYIAHITLDLCPDCFFAEAEF